jgi:hypothetical protein
MVIKWQFIIIPLVVICVGYLMAQNQRNADCVREFQETLQVRAEAFDQNDLVSIRQRELIYQWIHKLVFPPAELAALPTDDPRRQQFAISETIKVDQEFKVLIDRQRDNEKARPALPPATCGQ